MALPPSSFTPITMTLANETNSFMASADTPDNQIIGSPTTGKVIPGILMSLIIFLSIFGNILVCLAVYTDSNLRSIGNLFVVSLAIADLLVACLVMPFAEVNDILEYWPFGPRYCKIWISFDVMFSTASILFLCAISLDRYIHIKSPLKYSRWMRKGIVALSIMGIWLVSALVSFPAISLGQHLADTGEDNKEKKEDPYNKRQCTMNLTPTFATVSSIISFFLPCIMMLVFYSKLFLKARQHVAEINTQSRRGMLGYLEGDPKGQQKVPVPYQVSEWKAATTVGIIVGTFLVCWVPFFCVNIVAGFCKTCISPTVFQFLTWCGYMNSCFNPIIYSIFNQEFRAAFGRILHRFVCCNSCRKYRRNRFEYYSTTTSSAIFVEAGELRCCPAFSSCCSICSCYCYCCSWCFGPDDKHVEQRKKRTSASSEGGLQSLAHHQNGSPSVVTECRELEIISSPQIACEKRQSPMEDAEDIGECISEI